jgi:hypothetical protein
MAGGWSFEVGLGGGRRCFLETLLAMRVPRFELKG